MKRPLCSVALALLTLMVIAISYGCGSSTSTTTTTTNGTVGATQSAAAKAGVLIASGGASIGVSATTVGGTAGTSPAVSAIRSTWLKAFMGNPPPAFFTQDMTASTDGYFNPLATPVLGGKMTPYIRLHNVSDEVIAGTFFSGKKIAIFPGCSVEAIFAGGPTKAPEGIVAGVGSFLNTWMSTTSGGSNPAAGYASASLFAPITTMGDYLCWAYIYATMESVMTTKSYGGHPWPAGATITTPEATDNDKIGSMDNKMVYSGPVSGEIVVNVPCERDGRAKIGTHSGSGTLITPVATMDVTTSLTFTALGDPPTLVTVVATNETAPLYTTIVYITSPTTGVGTGEIWDYSTTPATLIGTLTSSATGGSVTIGATTETFTF